MPASRSAAVLAALALAVACQGNQTQTMTDGARDQVKTEIRAAADAVIAGFSQGEPTPYLEQLSHVQSYAENLMMYPSADSVRAAVQHFAASGVTATIEWTGEPMITVLGPGVGVFSATMRETLTDANGATSVMKGAWTAVYQRIDGAWKIVAAHESYAPTPVPEGT